MIDQRWPGSALSHWLVVQSWCVHLHEQQPKLLEKITLLGLSLNIGLIDQIHRHRVPFLPFLYRKNISLTERPNLLDVLDWEGVWLCRQLWAECHPASSSWTRMSCTLLKHSSVTLSKSYSSSSEVICQSERIQFRLDQHHGCDKIKLKLMTMVQSTGKKQNFFLILKGPPFPSGVGKLKSRNKFKTEIHLMWGYQGSARTLAAIKAELRYNKARTSYLRTSNSK